MNTTFSPANPPPHEIQLQQRLANTPPVFSLPPHSCSSSRRLTTAVVRVVMLLLGSAMGMLMYINYATMWSLIIDHKIFVPITVKEDQHRQQQPKSAHHPLKKNNKEDADTDSTNAFDTNPIFNKQYDNCIVGAGLAGSVIAENYAMVLSQSSLIIERRHHIGGNCFDYIDTETGICVSLFGAHLFLT